MDVDDNILVTFEIDWSIHPPEVQQTKWTLTGQQLHRRRFRISLFGHRVNKQYFLQYGSPGITYNHKTVKREVPFSDSHVSMDLVYDYAIDSLSVRWNDCDQPILEHSCRHYWEFLTPDIVYHWNCLQRRIDIFNADDRTTISQPYQVDIRENMVRTRFDTPLPRDWREVLSDKAQLYL